MRRYLLAMLMIGAVTVRYVDLWNGQELHPPIENQTAIIETTLGPRGIGAVAQVRE